MRTRSDYNLCPVCGASLDVGESCDCMEEKTRRSTKNSPKIDYVYQYEPKGKEPIERQTEAF